MVKSFFKQMEQNLQEKIAKIDTRFWRTDKLYIVYKFSQAWSIHFKTYLKEWIIKTNTRTAFFFESW